MEYKFIERRSYDMFFSNDLNQKYYPDNSAGHFRANFPYLKKVGSNFVMALASNHITSGFFNVIKNEKVTLFLYDDSFNFKEIGHTFVKPGYYPVVESLIGVIRNIIYEINENRVNPFPEKVLPSVLINSDGYVEQIAGQFNKDNKQYKIFVNVSPELTRLLGCKPSLMAEIKDGKRHVSYPIVSNHPLTLPDMSPPYKDIHLYSNYSSYPLLELKWHRFEDKPCYHKNPHYIEVSSDAGSKPIEFYFLDKNGEYINKVGKTSLTLTFKEDSNTVRD